MSSAKLNQDEKRAIATKIVMNKYPDWHENKIKQENKIAHFFYSKLYKPKELEKMKALPKGWLPMLSRVKFSTNNFGYNSLDFPNDEKRVFKFEDYNNGYMQYDIKLQDKLDEMIEKANSFEKEYDEAFSEVHAVVRSYNSASALIKAWPEIQDIVCDCVSDGAPRHVPAPILKEMTEKYNLPPEGAMSES